LTSSDVFPDGNSSGIDDYVMDYWDSDLKSTRSLKLSRVDQSTDFFRPTPGLALIPVIPEKLCSAFSYINWKSYVLDDRRTYHTEYYRNEGGKSETQKVVSLRCFIAGSYGQGSLEVKPFTLISEEKQGHLRWKLRAEDGTIFENHGKIRAERNYLYPRGAVILKVKCKPEGEEPQVTCVGVLNFSNYDKKEISPVFFSQETLTG